MNVILNSLLYLVGLGDNPLPEPKSKVMDKSDFEAMRGDWENVGKDICRAMYRYEAEQ